MRQDSTPTDFATGIVHPQEFQQASLELLQPVLKKAAVARSFDDAAGILMRSVLRTREGVLRHSFRVGTLSTFIGSVLDCPSATLQLLQEASLLHDIGKASIPKVILEAPRALTDEEWAIMRLHPTIGSEVCRLVPALTHISAIVRAHHERYDGSGYPDGLAAERIPLAARILAIADAVDAMMADRPYCAPLGRRQILDELIAYSGVQFDPYIVKQLMPELPSVLDRWPFERQL